MNIGLCPSPTEDGQTQTIGQTEKEDLIKYIIAAILIVHGLIVAAQASGSFGSVPPKVIQNPAWVSWWPVSMGRSWLLSLIGVDESMISYRVGGLLWLSGGVLLVAAGLSILGFLVPTEWWRILAVVGAAISLFMLLVFLHPLMILGTGLSITILVVLLWAGWPSQIVVP